MKVLTWAAANWVTSKLYAPDGARADAVATTAEDEEVGVAACHVVSWVSASAAICSADILALTDWYAATAVCSVATLAFRWVCGWASSCMSCEMIEAVSSPLASPLMLLGLVVAIGCVSSPGTGPTPGRMGA